MNPTLQAAEAQLSVQQRFRIALARSRRLLARTFDESDHSRDDAAQLLAREFDESKHPRVPAGSPDGGQFGSGGGADAAADIPDSALDPKVVEVGGDAWNKATARRLEREYQKAKPALEAIAFGETPAAQVGEDPLDEQLAGTEDDDSEALPYEWDEMSADDKQETEHVYYSQELKHYLQSEEDAWINNGGQLDETKADLASDDEWRLDAIKEWMTGEDGDGKPNTETKFPYTPEQLADATLINYESDGEGNGKVKVQFVDQKLDEPTGAPPKDQMTLPGIAPEDLSKRLTKEMRVELSTMLISEFNTHAEDNASDTQPPEYLTDQAKEYMEENWENNMSDSEKFDYANKATDIIKSKFPTDKEALGVTGVPNHYDPLNETSGIDYKKTQALARKMSLERAEQVMKDRKIEFAPGFDKRALGRVDGELWSAWKGSSTSKEGQLLQVATASELGGRLNPKTGIGGKVELNPTEIVSWANVNYKSIGGFAGVKAYVRAKWETTQFLLDKAGLSELQLYRGISLDNDKLDQAQREKLMELVAITQRQMVEGHAKVPNLNVVRNGAASTSVSAKISNGWGSDTNRVVLRATVPRTAAISIPAYGINVQKEQEVVVAGTAWKAWDAWLDKAPEFDKVPLAA